MTKIFITAFILIFLTGCLAGVGPKEVPTLTPPPTYTPYPTFTPFPTNTPMPTASPTPRINVEATESSIIERKEFFTDQAKRVFADFGCVVAVWGENSFELTCTNIRTNDVELMKKAAHSMTWVLAGALKDYELTICFQENFVLSLIFLSDDASTILSTKTNGRILSKLVDEIGIEYEEWLEVAELQIMDTNKQ